MAAQVFPTKGNLISTKKSLELSSLGFELLDKKRNILVREMMQYIDRAKMLRRQIAQTFSDAYLALQKANVTMGVVRDVAEAVPQDGSIRIHYRSVMGVELPTVSIEESRPELCYGLMETNSQFDHAYICFLKVKELTVTLAEVENSVFRLAHAIRKTQRRANALKNIMIPQFKSTVKFISDFLDEKEREEFSRLKIIKVSKSKALQELEELVNQGLNNEER